VPRRISPGARAKRHLASTRTPPVSHLPWCGNTPLAHFGLWSICGIRLNLIVGRDNYLAGGFSRPRQIDVRNPQTRLSKYKSLADCAGRQSGSRSNESRRQDTDRVSSLCMLIATILKQSHTIPLWEHLHTGAPRHSTKNREPVATPTTNAYPFILNIHI